MPTALEDGKNISEHSLDRIYFWRAACLKFLYDVSWNTLYMCVVHFYRQFMPSSKRGMQHALNNVRKS